MKRGAKRVESERAEAERLLEKFLRVPSVQSSSFEQDPAIQEFIQTTVGEELTERGIGWRRDGIGNLIANIGAAEPRRTWVILTYAMTHPANRMNDPFQPTTCLGEDGRRWTRGRGASEQKGALVAGLLAVARVSEMLKGSNDAVVFCVSPAGETGRHDAVESLMQGYRHGDVNWAIVAIGTDNSICLANKGRLDVNLRVRGQACHSSTPWRGRNAIGGAMDLLARIAPTAGGKEHPELGQATITATAIRSWPEATHTVPDAVEIVIDRRLLPGDDTNKALNEISVLAEAVDGFDVEVEPGALMFPAEVASDSHIVELIRESWSSLSNREVVLSYAHTSLDAGFFTHHDIPAIMFGPGSQDMWHTDEEEVCVDDVLLAADVYAEALRREISGTEKKS